MDHESLSIEQDYKHPLSVEGRECDCSCACDTYEPEGPLRYYHYDVEVSQTLWNELIEIYENLY